MSELDKTAKSPRSERLINRLDKNLSRLKNSLQRINPAVQRATGGSPGPVGDQGSDKVKEASSFLDVFEVQLNSFQAMNEEFESIAEILEENF